jgi:hypothetical protein
MTIWKILGRIGLVIGVIAIVGTICVGIAGGFTTKKVIYRTIVAFEQPSVFASYDDLAAWLEEDETDSQVYGDLNNYALELQRAAIWDGYIINVLPIDDAGYYFAIAQTKADGWIMIDPLSDFTLPLEELL